MKKVTLRAGTASSRATTLSVGAAHGEAVLADRERSRVKGARDRLSKKSVDRKGLSLTGGGVKMRSYVLIQITDTVFTAVCTYCI